MKATSLFHAKVPHLEEYDTTDNENTQVRQQAFAGRLGGGQAFTLKGKRTDKTISDAFQHPTWASTLSIAPIFVPRLWKLAAIEGVGTAVQTFLSGTLGYGLDPVVTETSVGAVLPVALASVAQVFLISLFIWGLGPITGAHFNPLLTIGAFCCAVIGAYLCRAALGASPEQLTVFPGCYADTTLVTPGQAYAFESSAAFAQLFLSFALGLDPRAGSTFGPALAPLLIGLTGALGLFTGGLARKGYLGASNNPARCLGLMAIGQRFDYHYIHWTGTLTASVFNGFLYAIVPPFETY